MKNIDAHALSKINSFDDKASYTRRKREEYGIGDQYSELQLYSMPKVEKSIIGTRIDVCCELTIDKCGTTVRWCQGEVIEVSDKKN